METLTIQLSREDMERLTQAAKSMGLSVTDYAALQLLARPRDGGVDAEELFRRGLKPFTTLDDFRESLRSEAKPFDFDHRLTGWPDDESVDEFIETYRRWRREGG